MLMLRNILDRIAQNTLANDNDIIDRADIRVIGINTRDKLKTKDNVFTNVVDRDDTHYLPLEPDKTYCGLYLRFDQLGNTIDDISWYNHVASVEGHPRPHRADVNLYKSGKQVSASSGSLDLELNLCLDLNGNFAKDAMKIPDHSNLQFADTTNGFSFYFYIKIADFALQNSLNVVLASKRDNANYGWIVFLSQTAIHLHVYDNGTWYREKITSGLNTTNYLHFCCSFDRTEVIDADKIKLYVEGTEAGVDDSTTSVLLNDVTELDFHLFSNADRTVFFKGYPLFCMYWKDKILTQMEVNNLQSNNVTTIAITGDKVFTFPFSPLQLPP